MEVAHPQFNDPVQLLAWLGTHAHLEPVEQIRMAQRVRPMVAVEECHDVIDGFILGTLDAYGLTFSDIERDLGATEQGTPSTDDRPEQGFTEDEIDTRPLWLKVWGTLVEKHSQSLVVAAMLLLFLVFRGGRFILNLAGD